MKGIDISLLAKAFEPERVAVIGASGTRGKWSNDVLRLLIESYRGEIIPVNPTREAVEGLPCYPSVSAAPRSPEYAIIVVPRDGVLKAVRECVAARVAVVHIFSAGFAELSQSGQELQQELVDAVSGSSTLLIGPNSMGLYSASAGLTFAWGCHFESGPVSFVSQSGGICYDVLARGQARGIKFTKILSVGNCAHLDWPDYVQYLAADSDTQVIGLYIESVRDGYKLFAALKAAAEIKPVVVLKGGKTEQGTRSVVSHTGRLAGEYAIWRTMLRQAGIVEATTLEEVLVFCEAHSRVGAPGVSTSEKIARDAVLIGTGGGATVLLTDACEHAGLRLASLEPQSVSALRHAVPDAEALGGVNNPVDVGADRLLSDEKLLGRLVAIAASDRNVSHVLVHLNLVAVANNLTGGTERWIRVCENVPVLAGNNAVLCVLLRNGDGGRYPAELEAAGLDALRKQGISAFTTVEEALSFFSFCTILSPSRGAEPAPASAAGIQPTSAAAGRIAPSDEARRIVEIAGVSLAPWGLALNGGDVLAVAERIGFPVAIKTAAADVPHKSDAGCVRLDVRTPDNLSNAYGDIVRGAASAGSVTPDAVIVERMTHGTAEVVVGLKRSSDFGASVLVGLGGIWVEVLNDFAVRLCPVIHSEAMDMIRELKAFPILRGDRGRRPCDIGALADLIVAISKLGHERPDILELDLNPIMLMEDGGGAVAVDARVVLRS